MSAQGSQEALAHPYRAGSRLGEDSNLVRISYQPSSPDISWSRHSTLVFGVSFITLAILGLFVAVFQHWRVLRRLEGGQFVYALSWPMERITAVLLFAIGLFGLMGLFI